MTQQTFAALAAAGDYSGAVKVLDGAIDETRQDYAAALHRLVQLHLNRGLCNQKLHLNRKALKDYDAALALMPSNITALLRKGQVLQSFGKPAEARVVWQTAISVADPASDLDTLAEIHAALSGPAAAAAAAADATAAHPAAANGDSVTASAPAAGKAADANGLPATSATANAAPAATATPVTSTSSSMARPAAAATPAAAAGSKSKMAKGFFKGTSDPAASKSTSTSSSGTTISGSSGTAARRNASSSEDGDAVVEINCVEQQQQSSSSKAVPGTFGAQVQQMAQASVALQIAISQINGGQVEQAEQLLDGILASSPQELSALVARGTARALRRKLKEAVEDFTKAIEVEPRYPDTYKRRGQARSAMGDHQGALEDLESAARLMKDLPPGAEAAVQAGGEADCYAERGMLYQKLRDYRKAARELSKATSLDGSNAQAWNYLGLCKVSMGDIREGCKAYEKAIELQPDMREAWLNLGQALKEEGRVREAERALKRAMAAVDGQPCLAAYRLLATMRQGQGRQVDAIQVLDKALAHQREEQKVELLYLRAICYHALGYARKAVADYDACMNCTPHRDDGPVGEEVRMFQFLSFYQRELALFVFHHMDKRALDLCLDTEISPMFKECWCKKGPPPNELFTQYKLQRPLPPDNNSSSGGSSSPSGALGSAPPEQIAALTAAADTIGALLQNHHQGFLPNLRQQRAAGYAAVELGQAVRALLAERRAGRGGLWVNSEGSSGQGGCSGRHLFGWRDAMDIVVKWRQLAEPADQVVWVDLLTKREFEQGFGSHTPMYSGQTKCVRYYMNFNRALELAKECLLEKGHAYDAQNREVPLGSDDKQEAVRKAKTALELYRIIGQDSWVVVPLFSILKAQKQQRQNGTDTSSANTSSSSSTTSTISSTTTAAGRAATPVRKRVSDAMVPAGCVEGTRLTLVKVPNQPDAVEFSIRTPVTPPRWKEFDAELESCWDCLVDALLTGDQHTIAAAICAYTYYWYNFMPLARGTAAVGYTTMLGLFWAAGMPVTTPIPTDYQVDWEAILSKHPQQFVDRLQQWFIPAAAHPVTPLAVFYSPAAVAAAAAVTAPPAAVEGAGAAAGQDEAPATAAAAVGSSPPVSPRGGSSDGGSGRLTKGEHAALVAAAKALPDVDGLPAVKQALGTIRQRLNALNGPDAKPV